MAADYLLFCALIGGAARVHIGVPGLSFRINTPLSGALDPELKWFPPHLYRKFFLKREGRIKREPRIGTFIIRVHFQFFRLTHASSQTIFAAINWFAL